MATATATAPATDKQRAFMKTLISDLSGAEGPAALLRDGAADMLQNMTDLDRRTASRVIDKLMEARRELHSAARQKAIDALEDEGMYRLDGRVYRVQRSGAGRLYAKELITEDGRSRFEYAQGIVYRLRPEHRMTKEEAAEHSRKIGACCVCGITLTDPKSIARGIGPVCATRV